MPCTPFDLLPGTAVHESTAFCAFLHGHGSSWGVAAHMQSWALCGCKVHGMACLQQQQMPRAWPQVEGRVVAVDISQWAFNALSQQALAAVYERDETRVLKVAFDRVRAHLSGASML